MACPSSRGEAHALKLVGGREEVLWEAGEPVSAEAQHAQLHLVAEEEVSSALGKRQASLELGPSPPTKLSRKEKKDEVGEVEILRKQVDDLESTVQCVICFAASREVLLDPCKHMCLCKACAKDCTDCPICRSPIESRVTIFMN